MGRHLPIFAVAMAAVTLFSTTIQAETRTDKRMADAIAVLRDFTAIPEQAIPPNLLNNAYGVAVIPGVIKIGLGLGGRYGKGALVVRQDDGSWSNPAFITLGGGSFGWQAGAQSTDLVLVFKDRRSIDSIASGQLTLGGDASVAAGPVGRSTSAATDQRLAAEIYSYSRSRGLFAGIALDGTWLGMDGQANAEYYGADKSPTEILNSRGMPAPIAAQQFVELMASATPRLSNAMPSRAAKASPRSEPAEVKTYAIDPVESTGDETMF